MQSETNYQNQQVIYILEELGLLIKHQHHSWINPGSEGTENLYRSHISNLKGSTGKAKTAPIWISTLGQKAGITGL